MREIGFDGYAIDFVDCPPAMRSYLTRDCQFHRTVSHTLHISRSLLTHGVRARAAANCTPTEPRRPRTRDGRCLPYRRRELYTRQYTQQCHALAIRQTAPAESYARRASSAHTRRSRRFVLLLPYHTIPYHSRWDAQWTQLQGKTSSSQSPRDARSLLRALKRAGDSPSSIGRSKRNRAHIKKLR